MIDVHIHVVPPNLPGVGPLSPLLAGPTHLLAAALRREMQEAGITQALGMGCYAGEPDDPAGVDGTLRLALEVPGLHAIAVADPARTDREHLQRVESVLASRRVLAFKGYLGYLHYAPDHPGYWPYYELAERYRLPFFFHTGDTYSPRAKLKYAHPLLVDEVAVDFPNVRFVMAHVGNPWLLDAAEVVYKNMNVWTDVSGLLVGDAEAFTGEERQEALHEVQANLRKAFVYTERPNRFLYGSDWPLAPMAAYRQFIEGALPVEYHQQVFHDNARVLFRT